MMHRPNPREDALPFPTGGSDRARSAILPSETLRRILDRERARADRAGTVFTLVVVELAAEGPVQSGDLERLADALCRRIRATDVVGWFGERSLGIVLPATPAEGAWKFVHEIRPRMSNGGRELVCKVYSYPATRATAARSAGDPPAGGSEGGDGADRPVPPGDPGKEDGEKPVHRMEGIFGRPLPAWKRALDVFVASLCLLLLSPLFLLIAAVIRIVSPGPVFLRQERIGHMGQRFRMWKFRTMHWNSGDAVHRQYLLKLIREGQPMEKLDAGCDPRIIPFGRMLRQSCLDELPQLINVLRGDMTLVGPRPCLPYEAAEYLPWHTRRFDSAPGLTGLWQVSGKNRTTFKEMVRFDIAYARTISPWLDFKIMARTLPAIWEQCIDHFRDPGRICPEALDTAGQTGKTPTDRPGTLPRRGDPRLGSRDVPDNT